MNKEELFKKGKENLSEFNLKWSMKPRGLYFTRDDIESIVSNLTVEIIQEETLYEIKLVYIVRILDKFYKIEKLFDPLNEKHYFYDGEIFETKRISVWS